MSSATIRRLAPWALLVPIALAGSALSSFDSESFGSRFVPNATIQTARETVEWVNQIRPSSRRGEKS